MYELTQSQIVAPSTTCNQLTEPQCPAPYVCVDSSGLFKGFYKFRSGPQKSCEVLDVVLVVSSWDPPPWGTQIITLPPDTAVPNMPKTPENGVCESL